MSPVASMRRREFIALGTAAGLWAPSAWTQQATRIRRIGLLSPFSPATALLWEKALLLGLRDLGWLDGRNLVVERRYAEGKKERLPGLASDLVRQKVDVILTTVSLDTSAAMNATTEIPIVMVAVGDPVATGFVKSLARPGGNVTGLSQMTPDLSGKRLELLKEIAPGVSSVALLFNPEDQLSVLDWKEARRSAQTLGIEVQSLEVREFGELNKALVEASRLRVGALVILPAPILVENLKLIADYAIANRLPSTFHLREFAELGGLLSYGVDRSDLFRRAANYVDRILKGASPGDLPIEQPTKFELVVNLKTAKVLGVLVSPRVMGLADEVIE
jgi:putative tryptophan/tyrosine transport system substrate-binding protein